MLERNVETTTQHKIPFPCSQPFKTQISHTWNVLVPEHQIYAAEGKVSVSCFVVGSANTKTKPVQLLSWKLASGPHGILRFVVSKEQFTSSISVLMHYKRT